MKHGIAYQASQPGYQEFNQALSLFENIAPALVGLTSTGEIIYANHSACELSGYPREELEGLQMRAITPGITDADWSDFWSGLDQEDQKPARTTLHLSGKKELSAEFRALFNHPSGVKYCLMLIPGKSPEATGRRRTHDWPLDLVLNSMGNPIFVMDEKHEITFLNRAACQELGTTPAKAAGMTVYDFLPKRYADFSWEQDQQALDSGCPATHVGDEFIQAKYGESVTVLPFLDPGTSRKRLLVIVKRTPPTAYFPPTLEPGTSEPVPAQPKSGYLPGMHELLENGAPLGIFLKNTEDRYLWVNHALARLNGFEPKDFIGKRLEDLVSDPKTLADACQQDEYVYSTGKPLFNQITPRFNNQPGYCRLDKFPFFNGNGKLAGIIGLVVEIDERPPPVEALKEELASTSKKLSETETALRVLLERRQQDVSLTREELSAKVRDQILPYLEHLKKTQITPEQAEFVELIETNLKNFYDPAYARLSSPSYKLSPTELKVAQFVRDGKANKEIAKLLHLSKSTILTHRHHIRVKLGIKKKKVNLRSLLNS